MLGLLREDSHTLKKEDGNQGCPARTWASRGRAGAGGAPLWQAPTARRRSWAPCWLQPPDSGSFPQAAVQSAGRAQQVLGIETDVTGTTGTRVSCGARYEIGFLEAKRWAQRSSHIRAFDFFLDF